MTTTNETYSVEVSGTTSAAESPLVPVKMPKVTELDGIRAIAVSIVFLSHFGGLGKIIPGGLGVTIFFFLSGYLITSLLRAEASQEGQINLRAFYVRRTLRIMPPLYLTLAVAAVCAALGLYNVRLESGAVLAQIFFYFNYERIWGTHLAYPIPLWSLAVEEHFYLLFPLLFSKYLTKMSGKSAALVCAVACGVTLAIRVIQGLNPVGLHLNYFLTHTRIDSILFGCCLALWQNPILDKRSWSPNLWAFAAAVAVLLGAALVRDEYFAETLRYTLQGASLFVIFSYVLHKNAWTSAILNLWPLQIIGLYSYTLYLIHRIVQKILMHSFELDGALLLVATAALSMAFAAGMYHVVELPLARVRRKLHHKVPPPQPTHDREDAPARAQVADTVRLGAARSLH